MIDITEVRIYPNPHANESKIKAYASMTLGGALALNSIKIIEGRSGLFIAYPQFKTTKKVNPKTGREEEYKDVYHPVTADCRVAIQNTIINEYNKMMQGNVNNQAAPMQMAPVQAAPAQVAPATYVEAQSIPAVTGTPMTNTATGPARF